MEKGDWGLDLDEAFFPGARDTGWEGIDSDDATDLDQVRLARSAGFEPAPEAPLYCFLPAVWPREAKAWIRDTRIRHAQVSSNGDPARRVPWSTWDYFETESDANSLLVECGFAPRPGGRLWLLRPPPQFTDLGSTLAHVARSAERAGLEIYAHSAFADFVAEAVAQLFSATSE